MSAVHCCKPCSPILLVAGDQGREPSALCVGWRRPAQSRCPPLSSRADKPPYLDVCLEKKVEQGVESLVLCVAAESLDGRAGCQVKLEHVREAGKVCDHGGGCLCELSSGAVFSLLDMGAQVDCKRAWPPPCRCRAETWWSAATADGLDAKTGSGMQAAALLCTSSNGSSSCTLTVSSAR